MENNIDTNTLYFITKLLVDNNLKKTLKKLRKETNNRKLKEKYLPENIKNLNYKDLLDEVSKSNENTNPVNSSETKKIKSVSFKNKKVNTLNKGEKLGVLKGKDFKSEKYKKKRSSWKNSGDINNRVNSVIFSDSDS